MDTRGRLSGFFRKWQSARDEAKQVNDARREEREADELERARKGVDRFPPMGGGGGI